MKHKKHISKRELYSILDWHTHRGYDIQCTWQYHESGGWEGVYIQWHNDVRRLEYWLSRDPGVSE